MRSPFARRPRPAGLGRGERVLASAEIAGGGTLWVTNHHLRADAPEEVRSPWHLVDSGGWRPDEDTLWVSFVDDTPRYEWVLPQPGTVPEAYRERVQATVVQTEHVHVTRADRARVVLRRDLETGALSVQTIYRDGADPAHPELAAGVEDALVRLAELVGLER